MPKELRFCLAVILHTIVAVLGTVVLQDGIGKAFQPHSLPTPLWKIWILSLVCASFIGFFMWRTWRGNAAMWAWILPSLWFTLMLLASQRGNLWAQLSGTACSDGLHARGCTMFFAFTIPLVRGVSYSLGAALSSRVDELKNRPPSQ